MSDFAPFHPGHCPDCWAWYERPELRPLLGPSKYHEPPAPPARPARPDASRDCVHLGDALPGQPGCGCRERQRDCDLYGVCSVGPSAATHHCTDGRGSPVCPSYDPRD